MANEKRLIDVDAFRDFWNKEYRHQYANDMFLIALANFPAVDAVEVVHGRWCKDGDWLICLNCESEINIKNSLGIENHKNYCPNCGAKMDKEN